MNPYREQERKHMTVMLLTVIGVAVFGAFLFGLSLGLLIG